MRLITSFSLLILCAGCSSTKNLKMKPDELNGTWIAVNQEIGGRSLPKSVFGKQQLIIAGREYTFIAENVEKGELNYVNGKMDIYGKQGVNAGKHFTAIYKYENEQLTVYYNLSGDSYPGAFETKTRPALFLSVFKKKDNTIM